MDYLDSRFSHDCRSCLFTTLSRKAWERSCFNCIRFYGGYFLFVSTLFRKRPYIGYIKCSNGTWFRMWPTAFYDNNLLCITENQNRVSTWSTPCFKLLITVKFPCLFWCFLVMVR